MSKILILGASGQDGSFACEQLVEAVLHQRFGSILGPKVYQTSKKNDTKMKPNWAKIDLDRRG